MDKKSGFTMVELMVVIGIIAILSAFSVPVMSKWKARHEYTGALQDVLLMFRQARTVAVQENETVMVSLNAASGVWRAFVDDGGGDNTDTLGIGADGILDDPQPDGVPDKAQNRSWDAGERVVNSGTFPVGIGVASGDIDLSFDGRGFPLDASGTLVEATVTLTNNSGGSRDIKLHLSGNTAILLTTS